MVRQEPNRNCIRFQITPAERGDHERDQVDGKSEAVGARGGHGGWHGIAHQRRSPMAPRGRAVAACTGLFGRRRWSRRDFRRAGYCGGRLQGLPDGARRRGRKIDGSGGGHHRDGDLGDDCLFRMVVVPGCSVRRSAWLSGQPSVGARTLSATDRAGSALASRCRRAFHRREGLPRWKAQGRHSQVAARIGCENERQAGRKDSEAGRFGQSRRLAQAELATGNIVAPGRRCFLPGGAETKHVYENKRLFGVPATSYKTSHEV